jgi:hypothetical protein
MQMSTEVYLYVACGAVALIFICGIFFSKIKFSKDSIELQKDSDDSIDKAKIIDLKFQIKKIDAIKDLVEKKSYESGVDIGKMKFKSILDAQRSLAEEQVVPLREKFMEKLCTFSSRKGDTDSALFLNIVTIYFNIFISSLKTSFELNNWKEMSITEFNDMISRKINLLLSEWKRVVNIYYVSEVSSVSQKKVLGLIEDTQNDAVFDIFKETINTIFIMAKRLKMTTETKAESIHQEMKEYNNSIVKTSVQADKG